MKIEAYIVLKFYDRDKTKVDTLEKLKDYIFLPPENYSTKKDFFDKEDNRNKLKQIPIYLDRGSAEGDAEWWPAHTSDDYGVVRKVTIEIGDEVHNTNLREQETLKTLIKKYKDNEHYKEDLKTWEWYNKKK